MPPGAAGANVTGTRSVSPRCKVTGNVTGLGPGRPGEVSVTRPVLNGSGEVTAEELRPVTVTVRAAVAVAVRVVAEPTTAVPNAGVAPRRSAVPAVTPKPRTRPSLVPT